MLVFPAFRFLAPFGRRVLLPRVVIARHRHDALSVIACNHLPGNRRIQYLPAPRDIALPRQVMVKQLEEVIHLARLCQRLAIQPHGFCVRNPIAKSQPEEPHEG